MFKNKTKFCLILLNIYYNFVLFKLVFLCSSHALAATVNTPPQLYEEIQKIKSELNKALESDEHEASVIVQPSWTLKVDKSKSFEKSKVKVTHQNLQEAAALRAQIGRTVAEDTYAIEGITKSKDIKDLQASLGVKSQGERRLKNITGSPHADYLGLNSEHQLESQNPKPNIVYANLVDDMEIDIRKLQRLELNKRRTHEVLILKYIEEDFSFDLGSEVQEWQHVVEAGQEYFIGRRETDLLFVGKYGDKYKEVFSLEIGQSIACLETYSYWNLTQQQQEAVIIIGTQDKVLWYQANHKTHQIELYWFWHIGQNVTSLNYFALDNQDYLIINSHQTALTIYQFQLSKKEFWLAQRLQLESYFSEVCVLNTGRDVVLAIPQSNTAAIFIFNPHESAYNHLYFQFKRAIAAQGILSIAGFKMAGHSYLALSGYQPQILLYQHGDFISKTILDSNFGLVELFFPIPVSSYRDDLLLLIQHKVDFDTHSLTVVETLIWNDDTFETIIPVPCYVGHQVVHGVSCVLDSHREDGLKGASVINRGKDISIIVPRHKAESGLFRFHTELLPKNSELLDLQAIFEFLKDWVQEQNDLIEQAEAFLQTPDDRLQNAQADFSTLEHLRTPEFIFSGQVAEIYVNDYKWLKEDSDVDLDWLIQNIEELDSTLNTGRRYSRNLNEENNQENLDFDEVVVENLGVENVNGQPFFIQNGELIFKGQVEIRELENYQQQKELYKRQINEEDLLVEDDMEFVTINGIKWSDIKDNLVFKTQNQTFEELEVKGEIIMENNLNISTLNTLNFPGDYLLSSGDALVVVEAEKHFINTLKLNSMDTNGFVNGKNTLDAITLKDNQKWRGMPTFKQLEIKETLELHGLKHNISNQPQNSTLRETNFIEASCHFHELHVNGPVILKEHLDNELLGLNLKDIIMKSTNPLEEIIIPGAKNFNLVEWPLDFQLENSSINHIPVQDFVTAHTNQQLNIKSLEGYVYFYNLSLKGSYDGVKMDEVLKEVILLDKPLDLSNTEFIFPGELKACNLSIHKTLNGRTIQNNLQTLQEDLLVKSAEFELLQGNQVEFSNDILGSGKLTYKELHDFTTPGSNIILNELILENGLQTDKIHNLQTEKVLEILSLLDKIPELLSEGQIQMDNIFVTGDIQLEKLNELYFDKDIKHTAIWLNKSNYLSKGLTFKNRVHITGNLCANANYRGLYIPDIIDDMVVRSANSTIKIKAFKGFLKPVRVFHNTQTQALKGILMENIALKRKENTFKGSLQIKGNLWARHIKIQGHMNDSEWQDLANLIYFNKYLQKFVLKDTVEFRQKLYLNDLTVLGNHNDVTDLKDFFENLIYKNSLCLLKGKKTFTGRVTIQRGAYINHLNGHDLKQLFNNMVFIQGFEPVIIRTPVIFEDPVAASIIQVKNSIELSHLNACSLKEWLNNTLRVDQDYFIEHIMEMAHDTLNGNSLLVEFLNNIDLKRILTLNTPQTFNDTVNFSEVYLQGHIHSKGLVNKVVLENEYHNTLMIYGNQHISNPLNIHSIIVLNELLVKGLVNDNQHLQDVVTLQDDIVLASPVYFQSLDSPQLITNDLVTGIDLEKWFSQTVKYQNDKPQYIAGNWSIKNLKVKNDSLEFQYLQNGFVPKQYNAYTRTIRNEDKEFMKENTELWHKTLQVKYIEEAYDLNLKTDFKNFSTTLRNVYYLKANRDNVFLLLNFECESLIYKWLPDVEKFVYKHTFSTGPIDHIELLNFNFSQLEFMTMTDSSTEPFNCTFTPINIWSIDNNGTIVFKRSIPKEWGTQIYTCFQDNGTLWSLNNETLREYDLETFRNKQNWTLPRSNNQTGYRFVKHNQDHCKILLSNGATLALLNNNSAYLSRLPPFKGNVLHNEVTEENNFESILKPKAVHIKQHIKRILLTLKQSLSQQVHITQLSIPETDLFDEPLVAEFMILKEQLRAQNIFPLAAFNISLQQLKVPDTPAQVLTARVIHILWPALQEIHSYLSNNKSQYQVLCAGITNSTGLLIRDILKLAYEEKLESPNDLLNQVIQRIHQFEIELQELLKMLEGKEGVILPTQPISPLAQPLVFKNASFLPGFQEGEILALQVGSHLEPLSLWAVVLQNSSDIYIYLQAYERYLYQILKADQPRSILQLRIKQETFLMFIENCCQVHILCYQGSKGFVKFANIQSPEFIKQLQVLVLPSYRKGLRKYLLTLVLAKHLKFYEFVI